jgi:hypothetical protein
MIRGLDRGQRAALIISEMQRAMVDPAIEDRALSQQVVSRGVISNIASLAEAFRAVGAPIVYCTLAPQRDYEGFTVNCALWANLTKKRMLREGEAGAEIVEQLRPKPKDIISEGRSDLSGFHATELERGVARPRCANGSVVRRADEPRHHGACDRGDQPTLRNNYPRRLRKRRGREGHEVNMRLHLPLLASITNSTSVAEALKHETRGF